MANTTLRAYLDDLNLLLEQEALEEVIGHCRHILQHFPKNVDTYRILGKALLERGRHQEAGDVFQRVLSATPDDFTAHLGLSSAWEEQGQIDSAIMHLERAFEQEPNNGALQSELKRLYERRGTPAPERIQMTRGALARMYLKGKLYTQATAELETALTQTPERVDLQVLLVEALRQTDHLVEASEVALHVMETMPDSIEANRTLATLWLRSARPTDAKPFVTRLEQLDPFLAWQVVHPDGKELPRNAFQLPRLIWNARAAAALATDVPDWVSSIGDVFESPESVSLSTSSSDWLEQAMSKPSGTTSGRSAASQSGLLKVTGALGTPVFQNQDEVPDWFKNVAASANFPAGPTSPAAAASSSSALPDLPDWLDAEVGSSQSTPAAAAANNDLPDWLSDDSGTNDDDLGAFLLDAAGEPSPNAIPDWLADEAPSTPPAAQLSPSAIPDWMTDVESPAPPVELAPTPAVQPLDALSWLNTGPLPALEDKAPAATGFDWASDEPDNFAALFDSEPGDEVPTASSTGVADIDWLSATSAEENTESADEEDPMAWMAQAGLTSLPLQEAPAAANPVEADEETAEIDHIDEDPMAWMIQAGLTPPQSPTGSLDEFDELDESFGGLFDEPTTSESTAAVTSAEATAQPNDDPFAWMIEAGLTPPKTPTGGLQWLDDPSDQAEQRAAKPGTGTITPNWLSSMAAADEPASSTFEAEAPSLDWLNDSPDTAKTAAPASAYAEDDDSPNWLNAMAGDALPPNTPAESSDSLSLDWLGSELTTSHAANDTPTPAIPADFDAPDAQDDGLDWLSGVSDSQPDTAVADTEQDPIAWMQRYGTSPLSATEPSVTATADSPLADTAEVSDLHSLKGLLGDDSSFSFAMFDTPPEDSVEAGTESDTDTIAPATMPDWLGTLAPIQAAKPPVDLSTLNFDQLPDADSSDNVDWLSMSTSPTGSLNESLDAISDPISDTAPQEPALTLDNAALEDDWLNSFEQPAQPPSEVLPTTMMFDQPDQGKQIKPKTPAPSVLGNEDWLASFESPASSESPAAQNTTDPVPNTDWLGSLAAAQPDATAEPDWLTSTAAPDSTEDIWQSLDVPETPVGTPAAASVPVDDDLPAWMRDSEPLAATTEDDWLTPEAKSQFDDLLKLTADKANQPRPISDTGVLDQGTLPDWLSAFAEEAPVFEDQPLAEPATDGQPVISDAAQPEAASSADQGTLPDWLTTMAPESSVPTATPTVTPASTVVPSLDMLDFDSLFASEPTEQPSPAAETLGEFDFSSLDIPDEPAQPAKSELPKTAPLIEAVSAVTVENPPAAPALAQAANVVDTSITSPTSAGSFKFERKPAWMSKKKSQAPAATEPPTPPSQPPTDDHADLSNISGNSSDSSGEFDLPDWLTD